MPRDFKKLTRIITSRFWILISLYLFLIMSFILNVIQARSVFIIPFFGSLQYIDYIVSLVLLMLDNVKNKYVEDYLYDIKQRDKTVVNEFSSYLNYIPWIQLSFSFFYLILKSILADSFCFTVVVVIIFMTGRKIVCCLNAKGLFEIFVSLPYTTQYKDKLAKHISEEDVILERFFFVTKFRKRNTHSYDLFLSKDNKDGEVYCGKKKEFDSYIIELRRIKGGFKYYNITGNGDAYTPACFGKKELKYMYNSNSNLDRELPFFVDFEQYISEVDD